MSSTLEKSLTVVEVLAGHPGGLSITELTRQTGQPASGIHRTLQELARLGYVRQIQTLGDYVLTMKLPAMGLALLGRAGINDIAQPTLDRLAQETRELIRLSVIDGDNLVWVAVAQGATGGLRYDPGQEQGVVVHLASTSAGIAWLSTMTDDEGMTRVTLQGLVREAADRGHNAPTALTEVLSRLAAARRRGYAVAVDSYLPGMAAMAVPVRYRGSGPVLGCLSIAGPAVRMTAARMEELAPGLSAAALELGEAAGGSRYFQSLVRDVDDGTAMSKRASA